MGEDCNVRTLTGWSGTQKIIPKIIMTLDNYVYVMCGFISRCQFLHNCQSGLICPDGKLGCGFSILNERQEYGMTLCGLLLGKTGQYLPTKQGQDDATNNK